MALRIGPDGTSLPGLVESDVARLASARHRPLDQIRTDLDELLAAGLIEEDADHTLIRLIGEPSPDDKIKSFLQLQGWWANWEQLPPSRLKFRHVADLRAGVDFTVAGKPGVDGKRAIPSMQETWDRTFGTIPKALARGIDAPSDTPPIGYRSGIDTPPIPATATATATATAISLADGAAGGSPEGEEGERHAAHDPTDHPEGAGGAAPLQLAPAEPGPARRRRQAHERDPLPVTLAEWLGAIEAAAGPARFVAGKGAPPSKLRPNLGELVRRDATREAALETAAALGRYLRGGYLLGNGPRAPSWLASARGPEALDALAAWRAAKEPPYDGPGATRRVVGAGTVNPGPSGSYSGRPRVIGPAEPRASIKVGSQLG